MVIISFLLFFTTQTQSVQPALAVSPPQADTLVSYDCDTETISYSKFPETAPNLSAYSEMMDENLAAFGYDCENSSDLSTLSVLSGVSPASIIGSDIRFQLESPRNDAQGRNPVCISGNGRLQWNGRRNIGIIGRKCVY
ncbi:MAG: hypothetical protein ACOYKJ_06290 [Candidatus Howiella sp.]